MQGCTSLCISSADLAALGPFLLPAAPDDVGERLARVAATLVVDDLDAEQVNLMKLGANILAPLAEAPDGRRMIARHPDGAVFEYVGP